jgi:hypothetical protein
LECILENVCITLAPRLARQSKQGMLSPDWVLLGLGQ